VTGRQTSWFAGGGTGTSPPGVSPLLSAVGGAVAGGGTTGGGTTGGGGGGSGELVQTCLAPPSAVDTQVHSSVVRSGVTKRIVLPLT